MRLALVILAVVVLPSGTVAQRPVVEPPLRDSSWIRPYPPLRIAGDLYYVGTWDLSSYLITTTQGHILINTGLAGSVPMIQANVEALGFKLSDIRVLLATHAHWDHVAGMAEMKRLTGARMAMHEGDAPILEDGGASDFRFGGRPLFPPVSVDRRLRDGDTIQVGGMTLTVHHHPGHTRGASSVTFVTRDSVRSYRVVVANFGTINDSVSLRAGMPGYPQIAADYARTFDSQRRLSADIWVASHASQFGLHRKHQPGARYNPAAFMDFDRFLVAVNRLDSTYRAQLAREDAARKPR